MCEGSRPLWAVVQRAFLSPEPWLSKAGPELGAGSFSTAPAPAVFQAWGQVLGTHTWVQPSLGFWAFPPPPTQLVYKKTVTLMR